MSKKIKKARDTYEYSFEECCAAAHKNEPYRANKSDKRYKKLKKFNKKYGFHSEDCWSLDQFFFYTMTPRICYLRDTTLSYPYYCNNIHEWQNILNEIIDGFMTYLTADIAVFSSEENEKIDKALKLFSEHVRNLWD